MQLTIENVIEVREVEAKPFGRNSGHVIIPKELFGKKITLVFCETKGGRASSHS